MTDNNFPQQLDHLMDHLTKLSGVGSKTALRYALEILQWDTKQVLALSSILNELHNHVFFCDRCGSLRDQTTCINCNHDEDVICVMALFKHSLQLGHSQCFRGTYHILGGHISPIKNKSEKDLRMDALISRLNTDTTEIVLAFDATVEGDATAFRIKDLLESYKHKMKYDYDITRLSFGLPMGNSMEYVDGITMGYAFNTRKTFT